MTSKEATIRTSSFNDNNNHKNYHIDNNTNNKEWIKNGPNFTSNAHRIQFRRTNKQNARNYNSHWYNSFYYFHAVWPLWDVIVCDILIYVLPTHRTTYIIKYSTILLFLTIALLYNNSSASIDNTITNTCAATSTTASSIWDGILLSSLLFVIWWLTIYHQQYFSILFQQALPPSLFSVPTKKKKNTNESTNETDLYDSYLNIIHELIRTKYWMDPYIQSKSRLPMHVQFMRYYNNELYSRRGACIVHMISLNSNDGIGDILSESTKVTTSTSSSKGKHPNDITNMNIVQLTTNVWNMDECDWRFCLYNTVEEALQSLLLPIKEWKHTIHVPSNWMIQPINSRRRTIDGVIDDIPIYTNIKYPFVPVVPPIVPLHHNPTGIYRLEFDVPWKCYDDCNTTTTNNDERSSTSSSSSSLVRSYKYTLLFHGIESACYIFLNHTLIGFSKDSRLPCEFDVTDTILLDTATTTIRTKKNTLYVVVIRWNDGTYLEDQDHWMLAGIHRSVELIRKPILTSTIPRKPSSTQVLETTTATRTTIPPAPPRTATTTLTSNDKSDNDKKNKTAISNDNDTIMKISVEMFDFCIQADANGHIECSIELIITTNHHDNHGTNCSTGGNNRITGNSTDETTTVLTTKIATLVVHLYNDEQVDPDGYQWKPGKCIWTAQTDVIVCNNCRATTTTTTTSDPNTTIMTQMYNISGDLGTSIQQWTAETPNLYTLTISLVDTMSQQTNGNNSERSESNDLDMNIVHVESCRVGFRTVDIVPYHPNNNNNNNNNKNNDHVLVVNGKRITVTGMNRHEFDPDTGKVVSIERMKHDICLLKQQNFNLIRTSHYPNHSSFYRLCDYYGMYVWDETNLETHGMKPMARLVHDNIGTGWEDGIISRIVRMIQRDRNHPSIIIWSLGNEAGRGRILWKARNIIINQYDTSRVICYESGGCFMEGTGTTELTDIICTMYPNISRTKRLATVHDTKYHDRRPVILCEYSHAMGNSNGNIHYYWNAIWDTKSYPRLQGGCIWDFVDQAIRKELPSHRHNNNNTKNDDNGDCYYFAYGGDFNDPINDSNFCCNGIFSPDREPHPVVAEIKYLQQFVSMTPTVVPAEATAAETSTTTTDSPIQHQQQMVVYPTTTTTTTKVDHCDHYDYDYCRRPITILFVDTVTFKCTPFQLSIENRYSFLSLSHLSWTWQLTSNRSVDVIRSGRFVVPTTTTTTATTTNEVEQHNVVTVSISLDSVLSRVRQLERTKHRYNQNYETHMTAATTNNNDAIENTYHITIYGCLNKDTSWATVGHVLVTQQLEIKFVFYQNKKNNKNNNNNNNNNKNHIPNTNNENDKEQPLQLLDQGLCDPSSSSTSTSSSSTSAAQVTTTTTTKLEDSKMKLVSTVTDDTIRIFRVGTNNNKDHLIDNPDPFPKQHPLVTIDRRTGCIVSYCPFWNNNGAATTDLLVQNEQQHEQQQPSTRQYGLVPHFVRAATDNDRGGTDLGIFPKGLLGQLVRWWRGGDQYDSYYSRWKRIGLVPNEQSPTITCIRTRIVTSNNTNDNSNGTNNSSNNNNNMIKIVALCLIRSSQDSTVSNTTKNDNMDSNDVLFKIKIHYTIYTNGRICISNTIVPQRSIQHLPTLPRIGYTMCINPLFDNIHYYGNGPYENYIDRNTSCIKGVYATTPNEMCYNKYIFPVENGLRTNCEWVSFRHKIPTTTTTVSSSKTTTASTAMDGDGICIVSFATTTTSSSTTTASTTAETTVDAATVVASEEETMVHEKKQNNSNGNNNKHQHNRINDDDYDQYKQDDYVGSSWFHCSASLHSTVEYHNATHTYDLQHRTNGIDPIYVNIDHQHMGLGGDVSWSPAVYPEFCISSTKPVHYKLWLLPLEKKDEPSLLARSVILNHHHHHIAHDKTNNSS